MLTRSLFKQPIWVCSLVMLCALPCHIQSQDHHESIARVNFTARGTNSLPNHVARLFRIDAARMALRTYDDLPNAPIQIEETQIETYFSLLVRIYETDAVAKSLVQCGIHTNDFPSTAYLVVVYDPSVEWAEPLRRGVTTTKNAQINKLVEMNELILETQTDEKGEALLIFRAVEPLNMAALGRELSTIAGVKRLDIPSNTSQSSDIQIQRIGNVWEVNYVFFFKEENITQQHRWIYQVNDDGNVDLISETGAPVPEGMSCY
ncbi:MAG: hypothetical protein HC892_07675 [Saprospiraceae bacterium]|nr:hypothetical protein [Saprospiraceae bacterium]